MAWTDPKTWGSEVLTSADLNTHVRDNMNVLNPILIEPVLHGGGGDVDTDAYIDWIADIDMSIDQWKILADSDATSLELDIWVATLDSDFSGISSADSIVSSDSPIDISGHDSGYKADASLTGWTTSVTAPALVRFVVKSNSGVTQATFATKWSRD